MTDTAAAILNRLARVEPSYAEELIWHPNQITLDVLCTMAEAVGYELRLTPLGGKHPTTSGQPPARTGTAR